MWSIGTAAVRSFEPTARNFVETGLNLILRRLGNLGRSGIVIRQGNARPAPAFEREESAGGVGGRKLLA